MRWLWDNLSSLLLAFILALIVWVSTVLAENPSETREFAPPVPIEYRGQSQGLLIVGEPPTTGRVTIRAPESVWEDLTLEQIHLWVDLEGVEPGAYQVQVQQAIDLRPARIVSYEPLSVTLQLEPAATANFTVQVLTLGEPALGYRVARASAEPENTLILGPASAVQRVVGLRAEIDVSGRLEDLEQEVPLVPLDASGETVDGIDLDPEVVTIRVRIVQLERYRLVSVIPTIEGQETLEEAGYLITSVSVSPAQVILFSSDPNAVETLPGFVKTAPLDLSTVTGSIERRLSLELPEDISLVGDQVVLVQVAISPIEGSITLTLPLEVIGLSAGLYAQVAPETVDVLLTGPQPTLKALQSEDVRVILDLLDLGLGTHLVSPDVVLAPTDVEVRAVQPEAIEVTISSFPPPTPTPTETP